MFGIPCTNNKDEVNSTNVNSSIFVDVRKRNLKYRANDQIPNPKKMLRILIVLFSTSRPFLKEDS